MWRGRIIEQQELAPKLRIIFLPRWLS